MRPRLVDACYQQPDTVRALTVVLCIGLGPVTDRSYDAFDRDGSAVGQAGGERLLFHEVGEDAGIGC